MAQQPKPNILFILVDQMRMLPPQADLPESIVALNQVLSFDPETPDDNPFLKFLPCVPAPPQERRAARAPPHRRGRLCAESSGPVHRPVSRPHRGHADGRHVQVRLLFRLPVAAQQPGSHGRGLVPRGRLHHALLRATRLHHTARAEPRGVGVLRLVHVLAEQSGGGPSNLGVFRDIGFVDVTNTFLNRMALGTETNIRNIYNNTNATNLQKPWFAVTSYVNPHDITGWPLPWYPGIQHPLSSPAPARTRCSSRSAPPSPRQARSPRSTSSAGPLPMAPTRWTSIRTAFPRTTPRSRQTGRRSLHEPTCQLDASFNISARAFSRSGLKQLQPFAPLPYKLAPRAKEWYLAHLQFYIYLQYLVNLEIHKVLANMEKENGLLQNTIVVFTADHGEMGGAHGGQIEKWHNAYRETIHVPFVVSSPAVNPDEKQMRDLDLVTSHIDLAPTPPRPGGLSRRGAVPAREAHPRPPGVHSSRGQ